MSHKLVNILVLLIISAIVLLIAANSMTKPVGHDEHMYCAAGVLTAEGKMIYRDFSYVAQMPYHPLLCAALFKVLNTSYYLLTARILSSVFDILTAVCIVGIYRCIFSSYKDTGLLLGAAGAVLYVFNPFVDYANGFAWNHDLVIFCVIACFWLFISIDFEKRTKYVRIAAIGILLSFACFARITTLLMGPLFLAVLLWTGESIRERLKNALVFLAAGGAVAVWPLWLITRAPKAFFLNLFHIPKLNGQYLHQVGMVYGKGEMALNFVTTPACFLLVAMFGYLFTVLIQNRRKLAISGVKGAVPAVLITVVFFIIAFIPVTMWVQYFAVPVPFLIISFAFPLVYMRKSAGRRHFRTAAAVIAACVFVTIAAHPVVLQRIPKLLNPSSWVPVRLHQVSQDIAGKIKRPGPVLTLGPLFALEGGFDIYPEFSAGPFVYRIADSLSDSERQITHTTGVETLGELLIKSPPSAAILGLEPKSLEGPLFQAAVGPDVGKWEKQSYDNGLTVYFRR